MSHDSVLSAVLSKSQETWWSDWIRIQRSSCLVSDGLRRFIDYTQSQKKCTAESCFSLYCDQKFMFRQHWQTLLIKCCLNRPVSTGHYQEVHSLASNVKFSILAGIVAAFTSYTMYIWEVPQLADTAYAVPRGRRGKSDIVSYLTRVLRSCMTLVLTRVLQLC